MTGRNVIVHVHIFKNAGSSFDDMLLTNFKDGFIDHREDNLIRTDKFFLDNYMKNHEEIEAFSSHSVYHKPENFEDIKYHTVYFLRHPIERIKSVYNFEKKQPKEASLGAVKAKELGFKEYVNWRMEDAAPPTIKNLQTIFLAGVNHHSDHLDERFKLALKNLNTSPLIGIVDRYDESMVVFEEYLKDFFPNIDLSYIRKNVTNTNLEATVDEKVENILSQFDKPLQKLVKEKNQYDMELYAKANVLLDEKIAGIKGFNEKLENFTERSRLKQKIVSSDNNTEDTKIIVETKLNISENIIDNKSIKDYLDEAKKKSVLKLYEEALIIYEEIIVNFPNNPWAYFFQAEMNALIGNISKSKELFGVYKKQFEVNDNILMTFHKYLMDTNISELTNKKKVFIQANCQSHAIKNIFRTVPRLDEKYEMIDIEPVHLWKKENQDVIFEKLKECDIFLHQPIFESNFGVFASDNIKKYLKKDSLTVSFPNLYFTGYHPQVFYPKDVEGKQFSEPFDYHDKNIYDLYLKGFSVDKIVEQIEDPLFYSAEEIEENIQKSLDDLRKREKYTDIKVSDYIEENMIGQKLFHVYNHPNNELLFYLFNNILKYLDESYLTNIEKLGFKKEFLGKVELPVYPSVQAYMKIKEDFILINKNEKYDIKDMVSSYYNFYIVSKIKRLEHKENLDLIKHSKPDTEERFEDCAALLNHANINEINGKFEDAIKIYKDAITLYPMNIWGYILKGKCLNSMKRYSDAKEIFNIALNKFPEKSELILNFNERKDIDFEPIIHFKGYESSIALSIDEEKTAFFKAPEEAEDYYIFKEENFLRPKITIYHFQNVFLTVDYKYNYMYSFYLYDEHYNFLEKLSCGKSPFISENIIDCEDKKIALLEDKFTKFNVAHLLLDKITRIQLFENFPIDSFMIFIKNKYISDLFQTIDKPIFFADTNNTSITYKIKDLFISDSSFNKHRHPAQEMSPRAVEFLSKLSSKFDKDTVSNDERVFIYRNNTNTRRIENFHEMKILLDDYNFKIIELENLSFKEQAIIFKSANIVIGTHGAGLTNILFCKEGTTIIEILPPLCASMAFWKLSKGMKLDYHCILAQDPDGMHPDYSNWKHEPSLYNQKNMIVPINKCKKMLDKLLSQ